MLYKSFRINVIIRIAVMLGTCFGVFYLWENNSYYFTLLLLAVLLVIQIIALIRLVEKTNRDLSSFLESVRYSDFSRSFRAEGSGRSFDRLNKAFQSVIDDFQQIRAEKEEHYFYMQNIIQHIDISIIAYLDDGTVEMINSATKKMFQVRTIKNISDLQQKNEQLANILMTINPGENHLLKMQDNDDLLQLIIHATAFKIDDRKIKLVSIKNIQTQLEEQEMEAWQKLIRVLTHEIMNSIAPIASLSDTTRTMLADTVNNELDEETFDDISNALKTIHKRSTGLIHFVDTYRNLTRIPKPNFTIFKAQTLFETIRHLLEKEMKEVGINCQLTIEPESVELTADEQLIEQVVINIIKNSMHALKNTKNPHIIITVTINKRGQVVVQIKDNGQGIIDEIRDKIFIPFFTTRQNGSGIGLSLSKQIMRLHNGTIAVTSTPDVETCFTLTF